MNKAVFLDRDGVINKAIIRNGKPYAPLDISELVLLPGVYSALKKLQNHDYLVIVVTNQPDVANGKISKDKVDVINNYLLKNLPINDIKVCFHNDDNKCFCRKPLPGMLIDAAIQYDINLKNSFMIGDRWRDIHAGRDAGCLTYFIDYGYSEKQPEHTTYRVNSLEDAVQHILENIT